MNLTSVLDRVRNHYLDQYSSFVRFNKGKFKRGTAEVIFEVPGADIFQKLYRVDFVGTGRTHEVIELGLDLILSFDPIAEQYKAAKLFIDCLRWDDIVFRHDCDEVSEERLRSWFQKWFDPADLRNADGDELGEVIHSVSVKPNKIDVDFGSAKSEAFFELLDLLVDSGARQICINASRTGDA
jgi:hypothetical protein